MWERKKGDLEIVGCGMAEEQGSYSKIHYTRH